MTELEKMKRAHRYLCQLAEGIDPISEEELPEDTTLNNVRLSRCFFYVADVLRQVIDNGGEVGRRSGREKPPAFSITPEELSGIEVSGEPLGITGLCGLISSAKPEDKKLNTRLVSDWLTAKGFLRVESVMNRRRKRTTRLGEDLGIYEETRSGPNGEYMAILYSPAAQQFVLDNLPEMLAARSMGTDTDNE